MKEHPTLGEISLMLFVTEDTSEGTSNVGRDQARKLDGGLEEFPVNGHLETRMRALIQELLWLLRNVKMEN